MPGDDLTQTRPEAVDVDFVVVGSGIAGLYAAIELSMAGRVAVLTKHFLNEGNTQFAQGGIAAALGVHDSADLHYQDTLAAGAGLCAGPAVRVMVEQGPGYVRGLMHLGARFDRRAGQLAMAREGAHSLGRILRAGGDATGEEIEGVLARRAREDAIKVHEKTFVTSLIVEDGLCVGLRAMAGARPVEFRARGVVFATGGMGQVFSHTTNATVVTGDGMALAWLAGAQLMDMEFLQFHPTALALPGNPRLLITEAMRGEGALLLNASLERFMPKYHPLAELAPRDVVARAIFREAWNDGRDHVWLDARRLKDGEVRASERFPTIDARLREHRLDMERDLIPVCPVAHYAMGGIRTDTWARTSLPGLWACGETACVGTHGANRLASNSLLESLVFAGRAAASMTEWDGGAWPAQLLPVMDSPRGAVELPGIFLARDVDREEAPGSDAAVIATLRELMWRRYGLVREPEGMQQGVDQLLELAAQLGSVPAMAMVADWEAHNLVTVGTIVGCAALFRRESRGAHYRTDFEGPDPAWAAHTVLWRDGNLLRYGIVPLENVEV